MLRGIFIFLSARLPDQFTPWIRCLTSLLILPELEHMSMVRVRWLVYRYPCGGLAYIEESDLSIARKDHH